MLRNHCAHARFVWNLVVEQQSWWRPGRTSAPGWAEQCRQLSAARQEHQWLAAGSVMVQQQALRDHVQAMANYLNGTHRKPTWRKAGRDEGFRIVALRPGHVRRLSRRWGQVFIPKAGWVRFRWSRAVPGAKSFRVTLDRSGRWHVAFAVVPNPIAGPGTGQVVGVDRGVAVSAALSTGEMLTCPRLSVGRQRRLRQLKRRLARARRGSNRRTQLEARHRQAAGPRGRRPQGLGREALHQPGPPIRCDPGRGSAGAVHDPLGKRHRRRTREQCTS